MRGRLLCLALVGLFATGAVVGCGVPAPKPVLFPLLTGKPGPVAARLSVTQFRDLQPDVQAAAFAAAKDVHGGAALLHGGNIGIRSVVRSGHVIRTAPATGQYPAEVAAVDARSATELYGSAVGSRLALRGWVVMSATSASLFGARAGDYLQVWTWTNRRIAPFYVAAVVPDTSVPAEITMSTTTAAGIGFYRPTSVQLYGYPSEAAIDQALESHGLPRVDARVTRGGGSPTPDSTLSLAVTKAKLGQFWYVPNSNGSITVDPAWVAANVVHYHFSGIPISAWCDKFVAPGIQGALNEIAASGLSGAIDVANTNTYGGCYGPREVRASGGTTGGNLSRHTWAMAIDINTSENPMGAVPTMDCRVVRIFRKWGFAWGGNFTTPDGMHFEWVGQNRSQIAYPSRYCPNIITPTASAASVNGAGAGAPPPPPPGTVSMQLEPQGDE